MCLCGYLLFGWVVVLGKIQHTYGGYLNVSSVLHFDASMYGVSVSSIQRLIL